MENQKADVDIPTFFAGRSIFITGGTGFLGKVLIEKLLRSCSDVAELFVLIRPKKGVSANDRLKKALDNKLFDLLRSKQPSSLEKIIPINGDLAAENLGLLPSDREMLIDRVSVIFHCAATVRFDEDLKDAIFSNTRSTQNICILAENMKQLVVLIHVSTTYGQCDKPVVKEMLYPTEFDWKKTIKIAESCDEHLLKILTAKYMKNVPNTYILSKILAEQVISDYSKSLPCVIIRPSIVISTLEDPLKGWIDNFNGPVGLLIGGGKGLVRIFWADSSIISDYMPVDLVIKCMIITAWKRGIQPKNNIVDVYHCSSNGMKSLSLKTIMNVGYEITKDIPIENVIWKPQTIITNSNFIYYILLLLLHVIPAIILDGILKLIGARPMVLKLQRKIYVANQALKYFLSNNWKFDNTASVETTDLVSHKDFLINKECGSCEFFKNAIIGAKIYLMNENMDDLEAAKRHCKRLDWLHTILKTLFVLIMLWILYRNNVFSCITDIY